MLENLSTSCSFSIASTTMLKPMNHSPARIVKGEPRAAWLAASAIRAVATKTAITGR